MSACPWCKDDPAASMRASWEFTVPDEALSLNDHNQNDSQGWAYRRARDRWIAAMKVAANQGNITRPEERRRVTLTRLYSGKQRELDHDNFVGGSKLVVDAMVRAGILLSDAPRWVVVHYLQTKGTERGLRVLVEEFGPP